MACKKQTVPFAGTPEQEAELKSVIAQLKDQPGALMPVMQKAQDIYGYLPIEVQTMISDEMGIPLEKVYGVSTFYAQFALQPKGKYLSLIHISPRTRTHASVSKIRAITFSTLLVVTGLLSPITTPRSPLFKNACPSNSLVIQSVTLN